MNNGSVLRQINALIKEHGYAHVAKLLNERDTQSLKRWIRDKKVPEYKINLISEYLTRGTNVRAK